MTHLLGQNIKQVVIMDKIRRALHVVYQPYFLPLFDRPKLKLSFLIALKVRPCIAKHSQFKNYSLEKKNTCFEMPLLLQIFDIAFNYFYDLYSNKFQIKHTILLLVLQPKDEPEHFH